MLALKLFRSHCLRPFQQFSSLHRSKPRTIDRHEALAQRSQQPRLSLLEELFPEDAQRNTPGSEAGEPNIPRLPLPEIDNFSEEFPNDPGRSNAETKKLTQDATAAAFRQQHLAVLTLHVASKSLVEGDFRRVAPRGKHIDDWTGPGEILKVIAARDPRTLDQSGHYFILFPNPAHARAYQNHVAHLHRVSRTYTPTSIESPLPLQPGTNGKGEDVYTLLQDYALMPPSQKVPLSLMYPSYGASLKAVLQARGYQQLVGEDKKAGRSVLFWVDGQQLATHVIRDNVAADGRKRGLAWNMSIEKVDPSQAVVDEGEDPDISDYDGSAELRPDRYNAPRWILSFTDEDEARRFIRVWNRKPFPLARGDGPRLVHTEFMW